MPNPSLKLSGFEFSDLFHSDGLNRLDQQFLNQLLQTSPTLHADLLSYRNADKIFPPIVLSQLLIDCAVQLEDFLIELFNIVDEAEHLQAKTLLHNPVAAFKKFFVLRRAKRLLSQIDHLPTFLELNQWLQSELEKMPFYSKDPELSVSLLANHYVTESEIYPDEIEKLTQWCAHALVTPDAKMIVKNWTSFRIPERIEYDNLVPHLSAEDNKLNRLACAEDKLTLRDGFKLTDPRMNVREVQDEVNYCIYCHDHEGDFCSKGFPVKKGDPTQGLKKNPLGSILTGCPLEEKISEMHSLKRDGNSLAALAMVMVDNPMCPATGHRICNDCMKACIYQKQEPVNIPQIETRVLSDVFSLRWGVEFMIY